MEIIRKYYRKRKGEDMRRGKIRKRIRKCERKRWFVGSYDMDKNYGGEKGKCEGNRGRKLGKFREKLLK